MNIGRLDRRIDIVSRSDVKDDATGELQPSWLLFKRLPAELVPNSSAERVIGVELVSSSSVIFRIRYRSDITPRMHLVYDGQTYRISGVHEDKYGRRASMILTCVTESPERGELYE